MNELKMWCRETKSGLDSWQVEASKRRMQGLLNAASGHFAVVAFCGIRATIVAMLTFVQEGGLTNVR